MNKSLWYFIFIFFGFLIALFGIFMLSGMFTNKSKTGVSTGQTASNSATKTPEIASAVVDLVKKDLVTVSHAKPREIKIISNVAVEWGDSSLGCPKPGLFYSQIVTPGYKIIAQVGSEQFEYHTNQNSDVVLCSTTQLDQSDL